MKDITASELLRMACEYAEQDREAFVMAHAHMPDDPAAVEAVRFLDLLRKYKAKRWGLSPMAKALSGMKPVPLSKL